MYTKLYLVNGDWEEVEFPNNLKLADSVVKEGVSILKRRGLDRTTYVAGYKMQFHGNMFYVG